MFGNEMQGAYIPQGTGYQYVGGAQAQAPKIYNILSNEEIQKLITKENQFSLQLTATEVLRAKCNHRRADGLDDAIEEDPITGISKCQICGYEFKPVDANTSIEQIQEAVTTILDMIQTTKLLYIDIPKDAAAEYYQIIPLIEKLPKLFEYAVKNYAKHTQFNPYQYNNRNMSTMQLFNALVGSMNPGFAPQPQMAPQQPINPQQPMGNPYMAPQQPYGMPYGAPYGMPSNGFGYMPQTAGFQYNPNPAVAAPAAPEAAPAAEAAPQTTVTENFKA